MQKAAEDAVSAFSLQFCRQEAAEEAVSLFSQQCCMQKAAGDVVYMFPQQFCYAEICWGCSVHVISAVVHAGSC